ncbi:GATA zinc finger-domain-containing protein [Mycotypha africana]|uniref:GATA zinc finger-domain-containing protein n=1 Tax=Mycotypha africana TaxID=64632 RepID=UPI002301A0EE|nr:GATA zinc finger-domain-containing protein [Mycotypha africana]KAI8970055.1 GATA zinc finger-domain-containing protein [Mycotypha africana]
MFPISMNTTTTTNNTNSMSTNNSHNNNNTTTTITTANNTNPTATNTIHTANTNLNDDRTTRSTQNNSLWRPSSAVSSNDMLSQMQQQHQQHVDEAKMAHLTNSPPLSVDGVRKEKWKRRKKHKKVEDYICTDCGTTSSPEWRKGPNGPKTLCNACGLRWAKRNKQIEK